MISVVVPMYNEREGCIAFSSRLYVAMKRIGEPFELVFSVGGTDGTAFRLNKLYNHDIPGVRNVKVVYDQARGLGKGIKNGILACDPNSDWILMMDGDGQCLPEEIPLLLAEREGASCVVGARLGKGDERKVMKKMISKAANFVFSVVSGCHGVTDFTLNFRMIRAKYMPDLENMPDDFDAVPWLLFKLRGHVFHQASVTFGPREKGKSKLRFMKIWRGYARLLWREVFHKEHNCAACCYCTCGTCADMCGYM